MTASPAASEAAPITGLEELSRLLRDRHGRRWRYRQPWLLLTGNDEAIASLLPDLIKDGYLIADHAVLLWRGARKGQPDQGWLRQLRKLRRRRPVDAVVLVLDGKTNTLQDTAQAASFPARYLLTRVTDILRWSAPVYVLDAAEVDSIHTGNTPIAGYELASNATQEAIETALLSLRDQLAFHGVFQLGANVADQYRAQLSCHLDLRSARLGRWLRELIERRLQVRGVFFVPFPPKGADGSALSRLPVWHHLAVLSRRDRGRRTALHPITLCAVVGFALLGLWTACMLISATTNARDLQHTQAVVRTLGQGDDAAQLRALLALQQRIAVYETRVQQHAPLSTRFGLNHDRAILAALWTRYAQVSRTLLIQPVRLSLEASLRDITRVRADALQSHAVQRQGYDTLKAYLMLAEPARTDAAFLAPQMARAWPVVTTMPPGAWQDTAQRLAAFYAGHLAAHPAWRIDADTSLITAARSTLIHQIGLANADDTVYRAILARVSGKYADASLATLLHGADAQGLFSTSQTVPGVYTRAAWDGMVAQAIDDAAQAQPVASDGVLTDSARAPHAGRDDASSSAPDPSDLKARLTARYFADYTAAWQRMLNSLRWQPATDLNAAIDQLTRLTDAQTSPLIALMKSVQYEAEAGRATQALGDTLVRRAKNLIGGDDAPAFTPVTRNPLDTAFGPVLALMGPPAGDPDATRAPSTLNGVSLQSYLTAATTLRLTLQQIGGSNDAQAMARALAQAVFQGKLSTLTQVRDEASLTAASLGSAWAGFGQALFAQPLESAWQTVLQPAANSLNELWRETIAAPFNQSFNGRYPFFDTQADASLAELGRFIRPDSGVISRFLTTQLAGVVGQQGDRWVPNGLAPQALSFDPAFLPAMDQLSALGAHLYAQGDAGEHFDLMALPTPVVTRTALTIDQQQIVYFNQPEAWARVAWPGDGLAGHAMLTWETLHAGVRIAFDATGDWAFLRLLEKAQVKPLDSTRYQLTWQAQPDTEPLHYVLRTQLGEGPLELLKLRGFRLPERIFAVGKNPAPAAPATPSPRLSP